MVAFKYFIQVFCFNFIIFSSFSCSFEKSSPLAVETPCLCLLFCRCLSGHKNCKLWHQKSFVCSSWSKLWKNFYSNFSLLSLLEIVDRLLSILIHSAYLNWPHYRVLRSNFPKFDPLNFPKLISIPRKIRSCETADLE